MHINNIDKYIEREMINSKCGEPDCEPPWDFSYETPTIYGNWRYKKLLQYTFINSFKEHYYPDENQTELDPAWIAKVYYTEQMHHDGITLFRCPESKTGKPIKRIKRKEKKVMEKKCIMVTGHRPEKLPGGYNLDSPANKLLEESLYRILRKAQPTSVISGMALGVDQIFVRAALRLKAELPTLHIIAAVPCKGQELVWKNPTTQKIYHDLLAQCDTVKVLSETYTYSCMKDRNNWMVAKCTSAIAVYDGSAGGTQHAVNALKTAKKNILIIHPRTGKLTPVNSKGAK